MKLFWEQTGAAFDAFISQEKYLKVEEEVNMLSVMELFSLERKVG
jgi:hypothetical protein